MKRVYFRAHNYTEDIIILKLNYILISIFIGVKKTEIR